MISAITATHEFSAIHPMIRINATELFAYKLRNYKDLETFVDEVSAVYDKKTLLQLYNTATSEPRTPGSPADDHDDPRGHGHRS